MSKVKVMKVFVSVCMASIMVFVGLTGSVNARDINDWKKEVGIVIAKKQVYPRAALRREIEGRIKVEINIDREGNILAHNIKLSSGHEVLDREVSKLMKRVNPLPKPPVKAKANELTLVIPLAWELQ
ncbi:MAG: TonB family protein [Emcibacteraceae bacterium]|nr:TonB family protein [Emcibacteraceae bacterium]